MTRRGTRVWVAGLATAVALLTVRLAPADDGPATRASQVRLAVLELRGALRAFFGSAEGVGEDVAAARALAPDLTEPDQRRRLVRVVGRILDATHDPAVETSAVETLGEIGEPAGFAYLRRFFPPTRVEAIRAAGRLKAPESIPVLMEIVRSAEPYVGREALAALVGVGENPRAREAVFEALVRAPRGPRISFRPPSDDLVPSPPDALAAARLRALSAVSGRNLGTQEAWDAAIATAKTPAALLAERPVKVVRPLEPASAVLRELDAWATRARAHEKAADLVALRADLDFVRDLEPRITEPGLRIPASELVGTILEAAQDPDVRRSALTALGALGDPAAFRFVTPLLEAAVAQDREALLAAIDACARLRAPEAVERLLAFVDHEDVTLASQALVAAAPFVRDPASGGKLLLEFVDLVRRRRDDEPDVTRPPPCVPCHEEASRYQTLAAVLTERLNTWTGRELGGPESWYALVDAHRADPETLFLR